MKIKIFIHATGYLPIQQWFTAGLGAYLIYKQQRYLASVASCFSGVTANCIVIRRRYMMSTYFNFNF